MDLETARSKITEVAETIVRGQADKIDKNALWPEHSLCALQKAGVGGLTVPEKFGGLGGGLFSLVQATEILGQECGSVAMCFGMHCVASAVIAARATPAQVEQFLVPIVNGRHLTTLSLSEPGMGSHFYIPEMKMTEVAGRFVLNGSKSFVTNGSYADSYVASVVSADTAAPMGQFSMVVVPSRAGGIQWQEPWQGFGMRGNASSSANYENVEVASLKLLRRQGDQIWYVFEVVAPFFLMAMAGTYLGIAGAALSEAIAHLKSRTYTHSGTQLANVSVLQHRIGQLRSRLESARQLTYSAAQLGDISNPKALPALLSAKAEVSDCVTLVTNEVMSLMGGKGYMQDGRLCRFLRDARGAHLMSPTTDMLRTWTGRAC